MYDLFNLIKWWLQKIAERVAMTRFLRAPDLQRWVRQADLNSKDDLVELMERYFAAEDLVTGSAVLRSLTVKRLYPVATQSNPVLQPVKAKGGSPARVVGGSPPIERPHLGSI